MAGLANRLLEDEQECAERGFVLVPVALGQAVAGDYAAAGRTWRPARPPSAGAPATPTWWRSR